MCELFGASLSKQTDLREYLKTFYSHSVRHPHGWGLMRFTNGKRDIIREPVCAFDSKILSSVIDSTQLQSSLLAHIRLATVGAKKTENCHPYSGFDKFGREWTLIHNGTIYSSGKLMKYLNQQLGDTDSERIFLYLLDIVNSKYNEPDDRERFNIVDRLTQDLSARNKLNLMIFDGDILYVHKNMNNTLSLKQTANGTIFSTTPLDSGWEDFPLCRVRAYKNGKILFEGAKPTHEFVSTLEYISAMAAMNI